jgi:hypothetical protein
MRGTGIDSDVEIYATKLLESGRWIKSEPPVIQCVVHHRQNPIESTRRRCVDNIKIDVKEVGWDVMGWIDLAQDRDQWRAHVNTEMNLRVP